MNDSDRLDPTGLYNLPFSPIAPQWNHVPFTIQDIMNAKVCSKVTQQCIFGQSLLKTSAVSFFISLSLRKITGCKHVNPPAMAFCWKESLSANEIVCLFGKLHFNLLLWQQCSSLPFTVHKVTMAQKIRLSWLSSNKGVSSQSK